MPAPPVPIGTADLPGPEPIDVSGARCACRTVAEIDAHLVGLRIWRDHQLRSVATAPPGRRHMCRTRIVEGYIDDCNLLLDRRSRLPG